MPTSRLSLLVATLLLAACSSSRSPEPQAPAPAPAVPVTNAPAAHVAVLEGAGSCVSPTCTMHFAAAARGDTASFSSAQCGDAKCPARHGRLTEAAQAKVRAIAGQLEQVALDEVYGSPGSADGPISVVFLHHADGRKTRHAFDPMHPDDIPPALQDASALMEAVASALDRCESTSFVQVDPECARIAAGDDEPIGRP